MHGFNLHVDFDSIVLNVQRRERLLRHWTLTQPKVVNGYTTSRLDLTIALLRDTLRPKFPKTRWILRLMPDNGQDATTKAAAIYARHKLIFEQLPWITMLAGNKSSFSDEQAMLAYCQNTRDLLKLAGDNWHSYAYFRSPMGNPNEAWYRHYKETFEVNAQYSSGQLHEYSPNEYFRGLKYPEDESGLLGRFRLAWAVCEEHRITRPRTSIGEYGLALNSDPEKGWRTTGSGIASEEDYLEKWAFPKYQAHYAVDDVGIGLFMYPPDVQPWTELAVGDAALSKIEELVNRYPDPPIEVKPIPAPTPPPKPLPKLLEPVDAVLNISGMRLRETYSTNAPIKATLQKGTRVVVWETDPPARNEDETQVFTFVYVKNLATGDTGWMALVEPIWEQFAKTEPAEPPKPDPTAVRILESQVKTFLALGKSLKAQQEALAAQQTFLDAQAQQIQATLLVLEHMLEDLRLQVQPQGVQ